MSTSSIATRQGNSLADKKNEMNKGRHARAQSGNGSEHTRGRKQTPSTDKLPSEHFSTTANTRGATRKERCFHVRAPTRTSTIRKHTHTQDFLPPLTTRAAQSCAATHEPRTQLARQAVGDTRTRSLQPTRGASFFGPYAMPPHTTTSAADVSTITYLRRLLPCWRLLPVATPSGLRVHRLPQRPRWRALPLVRQANARLPGLQLLLREEKAARHACADRVQERPRTRAQRAAVEALALS